MSAELRKQPGLTWISLVKETSALLGGVVGIIHPQMYRVGKEAMNQLQDGAVTVGKSETLKQILQSWSTPFNALSVINNQTTPLHRDNGGCYAWFDLLATVGDYERARMNLPGLGLRLGYDPGTVVAFSGRLLQHGVAEVSGERACIAYYMREVVMEAMGMPVAEWVNVGQM